MKTHQGYTAGSKGAMCSSCDEKISPGEEAVLFMPAEIQSNGSADTTAKAIHGVVHVDCFKEM